MSYFQSDGIDFYFEERGSGEPLIFSHGLGGELGQVLELAGELPDIRLIVYDNRAHGRTKPLGDPAKLTFSGMANDMRALLDHLGLSQAFVGGVSMGAGIAIAFSCLYPHRVKRLVLNRPAWLDSGNPPHLAAFPVMAELVERLGLELAQMEFQKTSHYKELERNYPFSAAALLSFFDSQDETALVSSLRAIPASAPVDSSERLRLMDIPALVLANRNDPIHPFELARTLAEMLPRSCFREIPPKSQGLEQHYREFRRLVSDFLRAADLRSDGLSTLSTDGLQ